MENINLKNENLKRSEVARPRDWKESWQHLLAIADATKPRQNWVMVSTDLT